jgi:hypothetical protein
VCCANIDNSMKSASAQDPHAARMPDLPGRIVGALAPVVIQLLNPGC